MAAHQKVLVIDDDVDFRTAVKSLLESQGFEVFEAESGHEGLKVVLDHHPDVILVDIMMENDTEGYSVTHALKHDEEYAAHRNTPVFMISSIQENPDERFPMSPEADLIRPDRYLTKPLDAAKLLDMLKATAAG
jgi:CheY-like chemotaxis protein